LLVCSFTVLSVKYQFSHNPHRCAEPPERGHEARPPFQGGAERSEAGGCRKFAILSSHACHCYERAVGATCGRPPMDGFVNRTGDTQVAPTGAFVYGGACTRVDCEERSDDSTSCHTRWAVKTPQTAAFPDHTPACRSVSPAGRYGSRPRCPCSGFRLPPESCSRSEPG